MKTVEEIKSDLNLLLSTLGIEGSRDLNHCICPWHEDDSSNGSLVIKQSQDGVWGFHCMQPACVASKFKTGYGTVIDAVMMLNKCGFKEALHALGSQTRKPINLPKKIHIEKEEDNDYPKPVIGDVSREMMRKFAAKRNQELLSSQDCLEFLFETRGITPEVASNPDICLGIQQVEYENGVISRCAWVLPISDGFGNLYGIKLHKVNPKPIQRKGKLIKAPKCTWMRVTPDQQEKKALCAYITVWPAPEIYEESSIIFLCPGELKALALVSLGYCAVGITGGENFQWKKYIVERFRDKIIFIVYDNDKAGLAFLKKTKDALSEVAKIREIDLTALRERYGVRRE